MFYLQQKGLWLLANGDWRQKTKDMGKSIIYPKYANTFAPQFKW